MHVPTSDPMHFHGKSSIPATRACLLFVAAVNFATSGLFGEVLFVDNQIGSDRFDGLADRPIDEATGPVRSIGRALQLAQSRDTISIANHGVPYYETLCLAGPRHSGFHADLPFTIVGNGAIVDGATSLPPAAWRPVGPRVWRLTPSRKGHYRLFDGVVPLPETACPYGADPLTLLAEGHWCAARGSVYLKLRTAQEPVDLPLAMAVRPMGLSFYKVRHVRILDLTIRHFQTDGVNLHDLCSDVVLDNVQSIENARAGIAVGGTSTVLLQNCVVSGNREHSLLITELAGAEVDGNSQLDAPPTVESR